MIDDKDTDIGTDSVTETETKIESDELEERVMHTDGYSVNAEFSDAIKKQVEEVIPAMIPYEAYLLKDLCGEVFWSQLTAGQCRLAGRHMAQLVARSELPLCFADSRHEYSKYYRLK